MIEMIEVCHPNVILVEKTVSRDVQEAILARGMTLVADMKLHRLERIALCTGSSIMSTETFTIQKLKQCHSFHIEKFIEELAGPSEGGKKPSKTLMFLEGCPTRLGCTVSLKKYIYVYIFWKSPNCFLTMGMMRISTRSRGMGSDRFNTFDLQIRFQYFFSTLTSMVVGP